MQIGRPQKFDLERIYVASPCSVSWESMQGNDRSRLCGRCGLNVHNISGLTAAEAADLVQNREGRVCVRLHRRADGTIVTRDCPKGLRAARIRAAKFATSIFATILGLFSIGYGQRSFEYSSQGIRSQTSSDVARVEGIVKDPNGSVIPDATVTIKTSSGKTLIRKTDRHGRFRLASFALEKGKNEIRIAVDGFSPFFDSFYVRRRQMIDYPVILDLGGFIGVVDIRTAPLIDMRKTETSTTIYLGDN